jgi:hypothetical protein
MSMGKRNGLSRGVARRNARLIRLRGIVRHLAILAIDLAEASQALAMCDHDSRVLARRMIPGHAWQLDETIGWAQATAIAHGFAGVVVGCEPTGHRWRIVAELWQRRGIDLVYVPPMLVARAREAEDLTRERSDPKDAVVIARLVGELRYYLPERPDQTWARLRQLGACRAQGPSDRVREETRLLKQIRQIHARSKGTYGSPRMTVELCRRGWRVNHKRVERLMRANGMVGCRPRAAPRIDQAGPGRPAGAGPSGRLFDPDRTDVGWCGDLTYIPTDQSDSLPVLRGRGVARRSAYPTAAVGQPEGGGAGQPYLRLAGGAGRGGRAGHRSGARRV